MLLVDPLASEDVRTLPPIDGKRAGGLGGRLLVSAKKSSLPDRRKYSSPSGGVAMLRFDLPDHSRASSTQVVTRAPVLPSKQQSSAVKTVPTRLDPDNWLGCIAPIPAKKRQDQTAQETAATVEFAESSHEVLAASAKRICNYTQLLSQLSLHHFIIWKGKRLSGTPEFAAFRRRYAVRWSRIDHIISLLEDVCLKNTVPLALVDGAIVDALAKCDTHCLKLADLQSCLHNIDNLNSLEAPAESISRERDEPVKSALIIQSAVRRSLARAAATRLGRRLDASIKVQSTVRRVLARRAVLHGLFELRADRDLRWQALVERLVEHSPRLEPGNARAEIHVPSLSFTEQTRLRMADLATEQALQVARLCAAVDPAVHVAYVSPVEMPDELVSYYRRLFGMGGREPSFTIVVPEARHTYPDHVALASLALYSPACCRRLRKLAKAFDAAVIVPAGPVGWAERSLAIELDVPLLAPDPKKAAVYASRSGAKRVLHKADVNIPVGAHDIYCEEDFVVALAKLVASHLDIGRWIFAIDVDAGASRLAYLDVDALDVVKQLRNEAHKLIVLDRHKGETAWRHPDVQVLARTRVLRVLRASLAKRVVLCSSTNGDWASFLADLRQYGAVIEAEPRRVVGRQSVHACIRPDGGVNVIAPQEICIDPVYERVAALFPQSMVPTDALVGATSAVARQLFSEAAVGHFTLHFVAFRNRDDASALRLWATELEFGLNPFVVGHLLHLAVAKRSAADADTDDEQRPEVDTDRAYFLVPKLRHRGLTTLNSSSFFKLCRLHGLSFNFQHNMGLLFILVDSLASGTLGMLAEGKNRLDALTSTYKFFVFLKKHVNTAHVVYADGPPDAMELLQFTSVVANLLRREGSASEHDRTLVNMILGGKL